MNKHLQTQQYFAKQQELMNLADESQEDSRKSQHVSVLQLALSYGNSYISEVPMIGGK